jgi:hypothetical protein
VTEPTGHNGDREAATGRFARGNKAARGNPLNKRAQQIRAAVLNASTPADIRAIARKLIDGAKGGDLQFIREYLDRTAGKPVPSDLTERIERIEEALGDKLKDEAANGTIESD